MNTVFMILHIIVTVALIIVVLLQEGKDPGLKGIAGSTPDGDSFFNRNSAWMAENASIFGLYLNIVLLSSIICSRYIR